MNVVTASSLDKIFPDVGVTVPERENVMLKNERFHFQVAVCNGKEAWEHGVFLHIIGDGLAEFCTVRTVDHVPGIFTTHKYSDDYVLYAYGNDARLYPDILREENSVNLPPCKEKWTAFWVTVHDPNGLPIGKHVLHIEVHSESGELLGKTEYTLEVLDACVAASDFPVAQWLHYDSIANCYKVKPWTKAYYAMLGSFIDSAVRHGNNMIYVPLFTPPLNTYVGGERLDVQLVKVYRKNGQFSFDLSELEKFLDFALVHHIEYFEMCHLATQWGAEYCPKIMAHTENGYERIFGWNTSSTDESYLAFLRMCLGEVDKLLHKKNIVEKTYFHISDEPNRDNIARYKEVYGAIRPILQNYKLMDAVGEVGRDIIEVPVVATSYLDGICGANEFAYYCCAQCADYLSNRFLNMPSERNRILGIQLWLNNAKGFLHWGFNFYNDGMSYKSIDPYFVTDAGGQFQAGDSFVVYPGENGAVDSLRLEVFDNAIQDHAILEQLEKSYGSEYLKNMFAAEGVHGWTQYPHSAKWLSDMAVRIRRMLAKCNKDA